MAGDWLTIVLRLALYLDITAAFGVTMFGIYALRHDEPILDDLAPLSRTRWSICRHRHCAVNVGMTIMAKALAGRAVPTDQQNKYESDGVAPANETKDRSALRSLQVGRVLPGKDGGQSWQHTFCHQP